MDVRDYLIGFREMLSYMDVKSDGLEFPAIERNYVSGSLFDISNEHAKSILILCENRLYGSAFTLMRPLFETFVRGAWLLNCATDKEVSLFARRDEIKLDSGSKPTFGELLASIESQKGWPSTLSSFKKSIWSGLNSYTHGGLMHAARRFDGGSIQPFYEDEEVVDAVKFSSTISYLIFCEMVGMSRSSEGQNDLVELAELIAGWRFGMQ